MRNTLRPLIAELVGTFFLVFAGVGAIVSDTYRAGSVGFLGIALAHGVALAIGVSATMNVSGGHLNPAISLGLLSVGRIKVKTAVLYVIAQLIGASLAVLVVKGFYPQMAGQIASYGAPHLANDISGPQGIVIEAVMTFLLAFSVMGTAVDPRAPKIGGWGIGLTVFFCILAGGQMTGAALNPARAFGSMLVGWQWTGALIYWIGPILGAIVAMQIYERIIMEKPAEG
jgi:aquaporin TIP